MFSNAIYSLLYQLTVLVIISFLPSALELTSKFCILPRGSATQTFHVTMGRTISIKCFIFFIDNNNDQLIV